MALEEEILFRNEKSADDFVKFIHKKGFSAKKRLKFDSYQEIKAIGTADNLIKWLEDEIAYLEDGLDENAVFNSNNGLNNENNPEIADETISTEIMADADTIPFTDSQISIKSLMEEKFCPEEEDFGDEESSKEIELPRLLDLVLYHKEIITDCFRNHTSGDEIPMINTEQLISEFQEFVTETESGFSENKVGNQKVRDQFILLFILTKNNLLLEKEGKIFLKEVMEPGMVCFEFDATQCDPSLEIASDNEVTLKELINIDQNFLVYIEPDIVLFSDFEELLDWFNDNDVEEENTLEFFSRLIFKQTIVEEIIKFVKGKNKVSKDEIIKNFLNFDLEGREYCHVQNFTLSEEFLREVLHDLNKIHVLEGKDQKIRCSI